MVFCCSHKLRQSPTLLSALKNKQKSHTIFQDPPSYTIHLAIAKFSTCNRVIISIVKDHVAARRRGRTRKMRTLSPITELQSDWKTVAIEKSGGEQVCCRNFKSTFPLSHQVRVSERWGSRQAMGYSTLQPMLSRVWMAISSHRHCLASKCNTNTFPNSLLYMQSNQTATPPALFWD